MCTINTVRLNIKLSPCRLIKAHLQILFHREIVSDTSHGFKHRKGRGFTGSRPWSSSALMPFPRTMSRKGLKPHWWHLISLEFLVRFDLGTILATQQASAGERARGGEPVCLRLRLGEANFLFAFTRTGVLKLYGGTSVCGSVGETLPCLHRGVTLLMCWGGGLKEKESLHVY